MAYTEVDEKQLVRAYQAGDERAFDTIVRTQWKALFRHALRRLSDPESAEDAVQDTLLRAYRALPSFSGDLALRAWLHRILTNVCYDEGNRRRRQAGMVERVMAEPQEDVADAAEEAILHDTVRVMTSALQGLPESYREALVLRYVDGLSFREVADTTGITEENARARVHRGRQALSKLLSRIAVLAGFLVPGLRRAQQTTAASENAAQSADHVSLVTQLTSHAMNAAPTVSRLAAEASALPSGKSALLTGAIAAAAAVTVGGTAYTVHEVTQQDRKPAAIAAPLDDTATSTSTTVPTTPTSLDQRVIEVPSTTIDTLPRSVTHPFEPTDSTSASTSTSTTTSTTVVDRPEPQDGSISGDALDAVTTGPSVDLDGQVTLSSGAVVQLRGRLTFYDDGDVAGELVLVAEDGVEHALRIRGTQVDSGDEAVQEFAGKFALGDGDGLGLPDRGSVLDGRLQQTGDGEVSLALSLAREGARS